ncbi:unnamed protein product [Rotaria sp. Silwood2]|nr:unnamed protein product [Rotaria sp. Silwood2]
MTVRLVSIIDQIGQCLALNTAAAALFVDFKAAFNQLWYQGLWLKLRKLDCPTYLLAWLRSYLSGRSAYIELKEATSSTFNLYKGVPQGSCVGPRYRLGETYVYYNPNISELTLCSLNGCKGYFPFYSIRKLQIKQVDDIDRICSIFPSLEHSKISVYDQNEIAYIINRLKYLSGTEFHYNRKTNISMEWICENTNLIKDNFTYRLDTQLCILYMWLNNQAKVISFNRI